MKRKKCPASGRCVFSCFGETAGLDGPCFSFLSPLALLGSGKGRGYGTVRLCLRCDAVGWLVWRSLEWALLVVPFGKE